jgi:hypothetical protein
MDMEIDKNNKRRFDDFADDADSDSEEEGMGVPAKVQKVAAKICKGCRYIMKNREDSDGEEDDCPQSEGEEGDWATHPIKHINVLDKQMHALLVSSELEVDVLVKDVQELVNPFVSRDLVDIVYKYCNPLMRHDPGKDASVQDLEEFDRADFQVRGGGLLALYEPEVEHDDHRGMRPSSVYVAYLCKPCADETADEMVNGDDLVNHCLPKGCSHPEWVKPSREEPIKCVKDLYRAHKIVLACKCTKAAEEAKRRAKILELKKKSVKAAAARKQKRDDKKKKDMAASS